MKKFVSLIITFLLVISLSGCGKESDALKFKNEYENINGEAIEGKDYKVRTLDIDSDNPIIYLNLDDALRVVKEETAIIYFGFARCPWCRSIIETLLEVAKDLKINKIYYVDVYDSRDVLQVNEEGKIEITKEAPDAYYELLTLLDDVLEDYMITDNDGNSINTGEKRIYAPNVVAVKDGKVLGLETGIPCNLENPYQEITKEMHDETYDLFKCLLEEIVDKGGTCSINKSC